MFANDSVFAVELGEQPRHQPGRLRHRALVANIAALAYIVYRAKKLGVNPYTHEVFTGTRDFVKAMDRREDAANA